MDDKNFSLEELVEKGKNGGIQVVYLYGFVARFLSDMRDGRFGSVCAFHPRNKRRRSRIQISDLVQESLSQ